MVSMSSLDDSFGAEAGTGTMVQSITPLGAVGSPEALPSLSSANAEQTVTVVRAEYHPTVHDIPPDERPRERLQKYGADSLALSELLAIILRTGTAGENVIELSSKLLAKYNGLSGLMSADFHELSAEHGLGLPSPLTYHLKATSSQA